MLFNAIGWAIEDEALTPVRTKTLTARPDPGRSAGNRRALQVVNIAGVPARLHRRSASCAGALRRARRQGQKL